MPIKSNDGKPFNQAEYKKEWEKENMALMGARFKKEFVQEFKKACNTLNIKQSDVLRKAMQEVIEKANK